MRIVDLEPVVDLRYSQEMGGAGGIAWVTDGETIWMLFRCSNGLGEPTAHFSYNVFTADIRLKYPHKNCTHYTSPLELQCFLADKETYRGPYE